MDLLISEVPRSWPREGVSTPLQNASIFLSPPPPPASLEHDGRPARNAERAVPRISKKNSPITVPWQLMSSELYVFRQLLGSSEEQAGFWQPNSRGKLTTLCPSPFLEPREMGDLRTFFLFNPPLRSLFLFPVWGKKEGEGVYLERGQRCRQTTHSGTCFLKGQG